MLFQWNKVYPKTNYSSVSFISLRSFALPMHAIADHQGVFENGKLSLSCSRRQQYIGSNLLPLRNIAGILLPKCYSFTLWLKYFLQLQHSVKYQLSACMQTTNVAQIIEWRPHRQNVYTTRNVLSASTNCFGYKHMLLYDAQLQSLNNQLKIFNYRHAYSLMLHQKYQCFNYWLFCNELVSYYLC